LELSARTREWIERLRHRARAAEEQLQARLTTSSAADEDASAILPDFCHGWIVFNSVIAAELLAIVVTLVMPRGIIAPTVGQDLLLVSVFVQWIALSGTAVLCYTRRHLNRLPKLRALAAAYLLLLLTTFVVSELAVLLLWAIGQVKTARPEWYGDFQILNLTISAIANGLLLRHYLARHELRQRVLSEARARMQALQSRIRPHFVFNSLNIIASLTRTEPAKAEAAIEDMAELFRMMLSENENLVPLRNEIDVAKKYLALEKLRLDNRLTVNWDIGTFPRKAVVPVLTLQPILENIIRNGVEAIAEGGVVDVRLWEENDRVRIHVTGPVPPPRARRTVRNPGEGLDNIRQRFQNQYGSGAMLETREENGRFAVEVTLPTRGGEA
jgi:two-component system, LytTR family, sensor histidine kinase AlgZ